MGGHFWAAPRAWAVVGVLALAVMAGRSYGVWGYLVGGIVLVLLALPASTSQES